MLKITGVPVLVTLAAGGLACASEVTSSDADAETGTGTETSAETDTGTETDTGDGDGDGDPLDGPELEWTTECVLGSSDISELDPDVECASTKVPLDWSDPNSATINSIVFRLPATGPRRGELWMLDGGPGGSGLYYLADHDTTEAIRAEGWDVVVPAHRGTILPQFSCVDPDSPACFDMLSEAWGADLATFNTVAAAHDLAALVHRNPRSPDDRIIVLGISYGTFWAEHYGALHPDQPDGIVLDSIVPADVELLGQLALQEEATRELLARCSSDPICSSGTGFDDPDAFADAVVGAVDAGDCGGPDGGSWSESSWALTLGMLVNNHNTREFVPLILALIQRCTPETTALASDLVSGLFDNAFAAQPPAQDRWIAPRPAGGYVVDPTLYFSDVLTNLVLGTSMVPDGVEPGPVIEEASQNLVDIGFAELFTVLDVYGVLPNTTLDGAEIPNELPVLMLNARFDLQTPAAWAEQLAVQLDGPAQTLVVFDQASHSVLSSGLTADDQPCGRELILAFAADPTSPLDTSCHGQTPTVDTSLQRPDLAALSLTILGTDDPWSLVPPP